MWTEDEPGDRSRRTDRNRRCPTSTATDPRRRAITAAIPQPTDRGASEVVAVALLIGIVVIGMTTVLLVGSVQLIGYHHSLEVGQAQQGLVQFDAAASQVATGGTTSQRIDLGLRANEGTLDVENDTGHITVTYIDFYKHGAPTELLNTTLGTVVYERDGTTVAYQGGGVWRRDGNGSVVVSPPAVTLRGKTLTMPVIKTTRGGSVYSDVQIGAEGAVARFPDPAAGLDNRLDGAQLQITIQSPYYRAWGSFFETETGTIVQYNDPRERVTVIFLALPESFTPDGGVIATSGLGEVRLEGTGAYVDSYNSTVGPYAVSNSSRDGVVMAAGNIVLKGDSRIDGDAHAGVDINVGSNSVIDGDAFANGSITVAGTGTITRNRTEHTDTVPDIPPINQLVADKTRQLRATNDNGRTSVIDGNRLSISGDQATLDPGEYYLEDLDLQGQTLVLNVTGGNITLAVRDWVALEKAGNAESHIVVQGSGSVRLFVNSERKVDVSVPGAGQAPTDLSRVHFFVERNSSITVPGDRSAQFQVFAPDNFVGAVAGSRSADPDVTAVVIAPAGPEGSGQFYVQQGDMYGAIVTGNLTLGQYGQFHFDRALARTAIPLAPNVPRIEYLYLTEYDIEVKGA